MPDFAGSKTQKPRCRQRQRGSKTKKGTNTTANPSYVLKKMFLPHLLYIVYQIFRWAQIFVGFFRSRGRPGTAGNSVLRAKFLQKNKPCKACTAKGRFAEKPLLPQIKYSTKRVKLQELNYIYSIPYFSQNTTAKPQNLPACKPLPVTRSQPFHPGSTAGKYIGKHNCSSAGKKEAPQIRRLRLHSKNFCLQELFPSACSIHAFISAASVLKSLSRTVSMSSTLCRPSFR